MYSSDKNGYNAYESKEFHGQNRQTWKVVYAELAVGRL